MNSVMEWSRIFGPAHELLVLIALSRSAGTPESLLRIYTKYASRGRLGPKFRSLAPLNTSAFGCILEATNRATIDDSAQTARMLRMS